MCLQVRTFYCLWGPLAGPIILFLEVLHKKHPRSLPWQSMCEDHLPWALIRQPVYRLRLTMASPLDMPLRLIAC